MNKQSSGTVEKNTVNEKNQRQDKQKSKKSIPVWIVLTAICVIAAACLAVTNGITKDMIAENDIKTKEVTRRQLIPDAESFDLNDESGVYTGKDSDGKPVGYVTTVKEQGFGGEIEVTVAVNSEGIIQGISVGGSNFSETAGLGAKSKEPAFQDQFRGQIAPVALKKNGGEIDAITSATITSSAVVRAVNTGVDTMSAEGGFEIAKQEADVIRLDEDSYATTVEGFGGPVYVVIDLDDQYVITAIEIGDDSFSETAGLGAKVKEDAFRNQYIGKTGQLTVGTDLDAVSGATISSNAVTEAVNNILLYVIDPEAYEAENAPVIETFERDELGTKVSAVERGMCGPVAVFMTVSDDGKIVKISVGDNDFCETEYLGDLAQYPAFYNQFLGMSLPVSMEDVDCISGATITTQAVVDAINSGYERVKPYLGE